MKILIIEDEVDIAEIQKMTLERRGHEVTVVSDHFRSVLEKDWSDYDVIVSDLMLPDPLLSGKEILEYFQCKYPHIRRVLVSAIVFLDDETRSIVDMFLAKPFCLLDLEVAIEGSGFEEVDGGASTLRNTLHKNFWAKVASAQ